MATASSELGDEGIRERLTPYWRALVWIENWMECREAVEEVELESHAAWAARMVAQYMVVAPRRERQTYPVVPPPLVAWVPWEGGVPRKEEVRARQAELVNKRVLKSEEARAQEAIELCRAERAKRPVVPLKRLKRAEWRKAFWVPRQAWSFAEGWWYEFRDGRMDRAERANDESGWWRECGEGSAVHAGECVFVCDGEEQDLPLSMRRRESRDAS